MLQTVHPERGLVCSNCSSSENCALFTVSQPKFLENSMPVQRLSLLAVVSATALLAACGAMSSKPMTPMFAQDSLPDAVKVPAGNRVALETVGMGDITHECRDKGQRTGRDRVGVCRPECGAKC